MKKAKPKRKPAKRLRGNLQRQVLTDLHQRFDEPIRNCEALWHVCYGHREKDNLAVVAMSVLSGIESQLRQIQGFAEIILDANGGKVVQS